jgi:hypothetical protein
MGRHGLAPRRGWRDADFELVFHLLALEHGHVPRDVVMHDSMRERSARGVGTIPVRM